MYKNLLYSAPFIVSFATASATLNGNQQIKSLSFAILIFFLTILAVKNRGDCYINISWGDVCIFYLLCIFIIYQSVADNPIDFTLYYHFFIYYFLLRSCNLQYSFTFIASITILLHVLICVLQYFNIFPNNHSFFSIGSTLGNPDMLGAYLVVLLPLCYMRIRQSRWSISIILIIIILLFKIQARTAIIAVCVTLLVFLAINKILKRKHVIICTALMLLSFIGIAIWNKESFLGRIFIWLTSIDMMIDKPMGWGIYAYEKDYLVQQASFAKEHPQIAEFLNVDIAHSAFNDFIEIGVTLGLPAFFLYISLITHIIYIAYKNQSELLYPIISFVVVSLAYFPIRIVPLFMLMIALVAYTNNENSVYLCKLKINSKIRSCILGVFCLFSFSYIINTIYAYSLWDYAIKNIHTNTDKNKVERAFERCYKILNHNGRFLISYAEYFIKVGRTEEGFELMNEASKYYSDNLFYNNLSIMYEYYGDLNKAMNILDIAVHMAPKNFVIRAKEVFFYDRIGMNEKAYDLACDWKNEFMHIESQSTDKRIMNYQINDIIERHGEKNDNN